MKAPDRGSLFFTEELSAKRTISTGEVSSQGNDIKLVDIVVQQAGSHANSCLPWDLFHSIMNDGAELSSTAKISKVSRMFRDIRPKDDCYDPLVVSIGPYHHGKPELQEMEKLKIKMAKQYVNETREKSILTVYEKVKEVAAVAKEYYESSQAIDDQSFTNMMFLDGCFILQYIYSSVNPKKDTGMKIHHTALVQRDLFLLENQLPYIVLKALMSTRFDGKEGQKMICNFFKLNQVHQPAPILFGVALTDFIKSICKYIKSAGQTASQQSINKSSSTEDYEPRHILDWMRKTLVGPKAEALITSGVDDNWYQRYQSAKELKTVGVKFRADKICDYTAVRFSSTKFLYGRLTLPPLSIDDSTKSMLLNMIAYETCPYGPDDFWVTSYICFIDSLINNAEDVTILRSQNVLLNHLGSDQDVADLFNDISKYLAPNPHAYVHVRKGIKDHYSNRFKKWMAEWLDNHFSSPWTVLAFLGAILAIALSFIQTYVALNPPSH